MRDASPSMATSVLWEPCLMCLQKQVVSEHTNRTLGRQSKSGTLIDYRWFARHGTVHRMSLSSSVFLVLLPATDRKNEIEGVC